jgi:DNA repair exonuclease SbcCD ATPase subunit
MELQELHIKNFKGLEELHLEPGGEDVDISGDNATGKTTIADATSWLFYDKDSLGKSDFEIKPHESEGKGLQTEVEGHIATDGGETVILKKVFKEKWAKKRGAASAEFTGHTTDYYVNGVPSKKKEYAEEIKAIADEETFKLLTNPRFFNEVLHWSDRRRILIEACGDVSMEDIIDANPELAEVPDIISGQKRSEDPIMDYKKIVHAKRKTINDDLKEIPARIDEAANAITKPENSVATLNTIIKGHRKKLKDKEAEINRIKNNTESTELDKELAKIETEIIKAEAELNRAHEDVKTEKRKAVVTALALKDSAKGPVEGYVKQIKILEKSIAMDKAAIPVLVKEWEDIHAQKFEPEESTCPTCGQELPADEVAAANKKALENFNLSRSQMLEENNKKGLALKEKVEAQRGDLDDLKNKIKTIQTKIEGLEKTHKEAVEAYDNIPEPVEPESLKDLRVKHAEIKAAIDALEKDSTPRTEKVEQEISDIRARIEERESELIQHKTNKKQETRIEELKEQELLLAKEYEKLEKQLHLLEQFTRAQVKMLDAQINSYFALCKWRLSEEQINGGVKDICTVTTPDGVGYWSMNNASRINIGLEIIDVLGRHKGVTLPVVIDNAESVTSLYKGRSQQIRLIVSKPDKELRVEAENKDEQKAA